MNCSLDSILTLPFVIYRVICKTVKEAKRLNFHGRIGSNEGGWSLSNLGLDTQTGLDISLIQILLYRL